MNAPLRVASRAREAPSPLRAGTPRRALALALALGACTHYVTVEEQGLLPTPPSASASAAPGPSGSAAVTRGAEERLTSLESEDELFPSVSPDGQLLLFHAERRPPTPGEVSLGAQGVYSLALKSGAAPRRLTAETSFASQPAFLPDGKSFVFVSNAMGPRALVRALTTEPNAAITVIIASDLAPEPGEPAVSPDGARVAFSTRAKDGSRAVAVIGMDGAKLTAVGQGRAPTWSPDGKRLVFVRTVDGHNQLLSVDAQTFGDEQRLTKGELDLDRPSFSPDGASIAAACSKPAPGGERDLGVCLVRASSGAVTRLSAPGRRAATPTWGKDHFVYFSASEGKSFDLYRVEVPGPAAAAR